MLNNTGINEDVKQMLLSDEKLQENILITLVHKTTQKDNEPYYISRYDAIKYFIYEDEDIKASLTTTIKELLDKNAINDIIHDVLTDYRDLYINQSKHTIYDLARLLFIQNKYKDDEIGQEIDTKIKKWLEYIKNYDYKAVQDILDPSKKLIGTSEYEIALDKMLAHIIGYSIPIINFNISTNDKNTRLLMDFNFNELKASDIKDFFINNVNVKISDSRAYNRISERINAFIEGIQDKRNTNNFELNRAQEIKDLKIKYKENEINFLSFEDASKDPFFDELMALYNDFCDKHGFNIQTNDDVKIWRDKADKFINHLINCGANASQDQFTINYTLDHLAFSDYQKKAYKLNLEDGTQNIKFYQATSKQIKAIDNARGGLITYEETNVEAIRNKIKEKEQSLKNTHIAKDTIRFKKEIKQLKQDLINAELKESELRAEYKNVCDYLNNIYKSMANEPKTSSYYKELNRTKKEQEQRKKEIERVIHFNGWQLNTEGHGTYELELNKREKESLKLTIENLSKQIARYTKEEQDIFDFLLNKYLHNTYNKGIKFTLREYEEAKNRIRPTNYLISDIQALRLLFREVWTYTHRDNKKFTFSEAHLFKQYVINGEIEKDANNLENISLDTEIIIEPTETLEKLLQDHDNYLYVSIPMETLQLYNDNDEFLAKKLIKYLNYLARINKKDIITISLDKIIEELQHYGLKTFNMLDRHKTYKTEIVDVVDKTLSILEGENHLNKKFIEVLDRQPFINYDTDYRGKSQATSINEWGKHKIKIKVFNLDDEKLLDTKKKQTDKKSKKNKATKK